MYDTHCHIQFTAYDDDRDEVIARCNDKGMFLNVIGTQYNTSKKAIALAEKHDNIYATVGLHPIQTKRVKVTEEDTSFTSIAEEFDVEKYKTLAQHDKVVAIGETGIDRFHIPKDRSADQVIAEQKEVFLRHYTIAEELNLPLVIHIRNPNKQPDGTLPGSAHEDMLSTLDTIDKKVRGVVHCFSGNWNEAKQYIDHGLHLGFTGIVTFPPKKTDPQAQEELLEVVDKIPLDRMLVETDAPYLAPQAHRGKRAEPWMVEEVIGFIAERRGISVEELEKITEENARRLFLNTNVS